MGLLIFLSFVGLVALAVIIWGTDELRNDASICLGV